MEVVGCFRCRPSGIGGSPSRCGLRLGWVRTESTGAVPERIAIYLSLFYFLGTVVPQVIILP